MQFTLKPIQKFRICVFNFSYWHLRATTPICRKDNFWTSQWDKVKFIADLQKKYNCPILHAGDLFEHWKADPILITYCLRYLPEQFFTIYGNHDLPERSIALHEKSGIDTLLEAGKLKVLKGLHWEEHPTNKKVAFINNLQDRNVMIHHRMVYQGKPPYPGAEGFAAGVLRKITNEYEIDLIVTGHNHTSFWEEHEGSLLVNPGSLTRHKADQWEHKPCIFLWYAEDNAIKKINLPIQASEEVMSREHLQVEEKRNKRAEAFVERLDTNWKTSMDFEVNLEEFINKNKIEKRTIEWIRKGIDQCQK